MTNPTCKAILAAVRRLPGFDRARSIEVAIRLDADDVRTLDSCRWLEDRDLHDLIPLRDALRWDGRGGVWDIYVYQRDESNPLIGNLNLVWEINGTCTPEPQPAESWLATAIRLRTDGRIA